MTFEITSEPATKIQSTFKWYSFTICIRVKCNMIAQFFNYLRKRRSRKHVSDLLGSNCINIAIRVHVHETGKLLFDVLASRGNITEHLHYDFNNKFKDSHKHVYVIPNIEAKFTNNADIVFNQTGISSFTIIKDNYTKKKGTIIYV